MFINYAEEKIEITATEPKKLGIPDTKEYRNFIELKKENPGYKIIVVKSTRKAPKFRGLTLDYMKKYIEEHSDKKEKNEILAEFYTLQGKYEDGKGKSIIYIDNY